MAQGVRQARLQFSMPGPCGTSPPPERRTHSRYSMPFFLHFKPDFLIETLPNCVDAEHPNLFPEPITSHDFLQERLEPEALHAIARAWIVVFLRDMTHSFRAGVGRDASVDLGTQACAAS